MKKSTLIKVCIILTLTAAVAAITLPYILPAHLTLANPLLQALGL